MRQPRLQANWIHAKEKPAIYHCISYVVNREHVLGAEEKEQFRKWMRIYEQFTGCRVLTYVLMNDHLHLRFTYRMHSLSQFMKGLMQRYTQWHNRRHERRGHLWEARFKSAIVEDGKPARTLAAYINLNPVRSGYVKQPEDYRWSSYGEAVGGAWTENGRTAQAGLARVWGMREELSEDAQLELWKSKVAPAFRRMMVEVDEETKEQLGKGGDTVGWARLTQLSHS